MKKIFLAVALIALFPLLAQAQFIDDALRYAVPNGMVTTRAAGLGVAYNGFIDDIATLAYNPAGLTLINRSELSIGFGFKRNSTETDFLHSFNTLKTNSVDLTHIGISAPFETGETKAVAGIMYYKESDYEDNMEFSGLNSTSSFIGWEAAHGSRDYSENMATFLALANDNFKTPLQGGLYQSTFLQEKGGMHNITGGASFELNEYLSAGLSITAKFGTYSYIKDYSETDVNKIYNVYDTTNYNDLDFNQLLWQEQIDVSMSGISGALGLQGKIQDFMRFGATIKFPTWYEIDEDFSQTGKVFYDNGEESANPYSNVGRNSYKLTTPFIFSAGMSFHVSGATIAAGVEYYDVTQLEFSDATSELEDLNKEIIQNLVGQTKWGLGVEYKIPMMPFVVRGSFTKITSPWTKDIYNAYENIYALGGGVYLGKSVRIDGVFQWRDVSELRVNYGNATQGSTYIVTKSPLYMGLQLTYRY